MIDSKFINRLRTQEVYLWEDENECYIKSVPDGGYFVKFPGGKESPIKADSDTVTRAVAAKKEVSKDKYENS